MKVLFFTLGGEVVASSRTRVYQLLPHLRRAGVEARAITYDHTETFWNILSQMLPGNGFATTALRRLLSLCSNIFNAAVRVFQCIRLLTMAGKYDAVYIQKLPLPLFFQRLLRRANPRIAFDFDDAVFNTSDRTRKARFDGILARAGLVTVENTYTAEYAARFGGDVLSITGPIDCERYRPRENPGERAGKVVIGWIGSSSTTPYLAGIASALADISSANPEVELEFIGASVIEELSGACTYKKWSLQTEAGDIRNFDIGLMPLPDDEWTRGKGGYKILQYMAAGIPSVASPVGINSELVRDGETGFLASSPQEWRDRLEKLVKDAGLRRAMGANARRAAEEKYSFEYYTPLLIKRLERLSRSA
jgi:glycosyltransferase involved in cell wall biosynthesis